MPTHTFMCAVLVVQVKPVRRIVTVHEDSAAAQPLRPQVGHNQAYFSAFFKVFFHSLMWIPSVTECIKPLECNHCWEW